MLENQRRERVYLLAKRLYPKRYVRLLLNQNHHHTKHSRDSAIRLLTMKNDYSPIDNELLHGNSVLIIKKSLHYDGRTTWLFIY